MSTEDDAKRIERLASQLLGDLDAVDTVARDDKHAAEQQKLQLIIDAFEQVGAIALDDKPPDKLLARAAR